MPQGSDSPRGWTLATRPGWRLIALCGLYFTQGLPYGFMFITLAAVLADAGRTPGEIGSLRGAATLPWAFKWIAGPIIDRFGLPALGRRRPWILLAQSGMILSLLALAVGPDPLTHDRWLMWALIAMSACSALQDVSVDALAVDLLREEERGRVNGFMYGSSYMGNAVGGAGMGTVVAVMGVRSGFLVIAVAVACVSGAAGRATAAVDAGCGVAGGARTGRLCSHGAEATWPRIPAAVDAGTGAGDCAHQHPQRIPDGFLNRADR